MTDRTHLLALPTDVLGLSHEFKLMADINGFQSLQAIIDLGVHVLPMLPRSNYRLQQELLEFLDNNNLIYLVEDLGE